MTSTAFGEEESIPERYTCDGDEVSPPLAWSGVPDDTAAVALVVDDPDRTLGHLHPLGRPRHPADDD